MKALSPRVCIVQEHAGLGGVHSIVQDLQDVLRSQSWQVDSAHAPPLVRPGWSLCRSAAQADVLVAAHNFRPAYTVWMLSLLLQKPWVVWVHGPVQEVLTQAQSHPAKRQWLRWLYQRVPHFVCISHHVRASLEQFLGHALPDARVDIIPNAVQQPHVPLRPRASPAVANGPVELGYVGRLSPEKQVGHLISMMRHLPAHYRLSLVGDGPERRALEQEARDLTHAGRVTFCGTRPRAHALCGGLQLTVLASRYEGGCPLSALESAAAGIAFVAPPLAALRETLTGPAACLLAPSDHPQQLAMAVENLLSLPPHQVQQALETVLAQHTMPRFAQQWCATLRNVAQAC